MQGARFHVHVRVLSQSGSGCTDVPSRGSRAETGTVRRPKLEEESVGLQHRPLEPSRCAHGSRRRPACVATGSG